MCCLILLFGIVKCSSSTAMVSHLFFPKQEKAGFLMLYTSLLFFQRLLQHVKQNWKSDVQGQRSDGEKGSYQPFLIFFMSWT